MTAKEIWYVWDKRTEVRFAKMCILNGGIINIEGRVIHPSIPALVKGVSCYTLGEKRERMVCEDCDGIGKRKLTDFVSKVGFSGVCIPCQGRGYIWKTEVGQ